MQKIVPVNPHQTKRARLLLGAPAKEKFQSLLSTWASSMAHPRVGSRGARHRVARLATVVDYPGRVLLCKKKSMGLDKHFFYRIDTRTYLDTSFDFIIREL